jgi:predicted nucleotidyltransferase
MDLSPDLIDVLEEFENFGVEYLIVGGWAVSTHAQPRFTKDLDLWIGTSEINLKRVVQALAAFGAPRELLREAEQMSAEDFFFFGTPPARIDLLRSIPGVRFEEAWPRRARMRWGAMNVNLIGLDDLIAAKRAAGRPQDLADLKLLLALKQRE